MKAYQLGLVVLLLPAAPGCQESSDPGGTRRSRPALPGVDPERFESTVRNQVRALQRDLTARPEDADANGRYGMLLHAYNWVEDARLCYLRAASLAPEDIRWWYYLGRINALTGRTAAAIAALQKAVSREPGCMPALLFLGELSHREGRLPEAARWYTRALEVTLDSPFALAGLGRVALERGDVEGAIGHLEAALAIDSDHARAIYSLAIAHRTKGDAGRAAELLKRHATAHRALTPPDPLLDAVEDLRDDVDLLLTRANTHFKKGEYRQALPLFQEIVRRRADMVLADYNIGLTLQRSGAIPEAISHYSSFLDRHPDHLDARNNLGISYFELDRLDDARSCFRKALAINARYYRAHFNLGLTLARQGQPEAAISHFETALAIRPRYTGAHYNLGMLHLRAQRQPAALRHFLQLLRIDPDDRRVHEILLAEIGPPEKEGRHRALSAILKRNGLDAAAIHALREGLARERTDWRTGVSLAWMLSTCSEAELRRPDEALQIIEPISRGVAADEPWAADTLGAAYAALGRFDEAAVAAATALRLLDDKTPTPALENLRTRATHRLELYNDRKPFFES